MSETIETERLLLRPLTPEDGRGVYELLRDDRDAVEQTSRIPWPLTLDGAQAWVDRVLAGSRNAYAVTRKDDGAFVGVAGFAPHEKLGGTGYWYGEEFRRQGFATEVLDALIDKAREEGLNALVCEIFPDNTASIRVVEKCGFMLAGEVEADLPARGGKRRLLQYLKPLVELA